MESDFDEFMRDCLQDSGAIIGTVEFLIAGLLPVGGAAFFTGDLLETELEQELNVSGGGTQIIRGATIVATRSQFDGLPTTDRALTWDGVNYRIDRILPEPTALTFTLVRDD